MTSPLLTFFVKFNNAQAKASGSSACSSLGELHGLLMCNSVTRRRLLGCLGPAHVAGLT